jgi:hypothetical protein
MQPEASLTTVTADVHTGGTSLKYTRTSTATVGANNQVLMVQPGSNIQIDVWVKGSGLTATSGKGARVYCESSGTSGYINGVYLPILNGTFGWTKQTITYTVPSTATRCTLYAYMTSGTTGTAWFDDLEVRVIPPAPTGNLILKPDFESATLTPEWSVTATYGSRSTTENHTSGGAASLKFVNNPTHTAVGSTQVIDPFTTASSNVSPGDTVYISGFVKGVSLYLLSGTSVNNGLRLYLQFYNSGGSMIGGTYPVKKVTGTSTTPQSFDWLQLDEGYLVPAGTTKVTLGCQMMAGVHGTAYFDDLKLQVEKRPLQVLPVYPGYRGIIHTSDTTDYAAKLLVSGVQGWSGNLSVSQTLINVNNYGNLVHTGSTTTPSSAVGEYPLSMNPPALTAGGYYWKILVTEPSGGYVHYFFIPIQVVGTMPDVYVDDEGWTRIKNGAVWDRFFPFGMYNSNLTTNNPDPNHPNSPFVDELEEIHDAGFNTILEDQYGVRSNHSVLFSEAAARQMKVIFSFDLYHPELTGWWGGTDQADYDLAEQTALDRLAAYRNHPNLLAWYLNDESPATVTRQVQAMYNRVKNYDPNHPTLTVLGDPTQIDNWYSTTDILAIDKYPVNSVESNIDELYDVTYLVEQKARGAKGTWAVPQATLRIIPGTSTYYWPTREEYRNQVYMGLIGGAKGLICWTYYDYGDIGTSTHTTHWPKVVGMADDMTGGLGGPNAGNGGVLELVRNGTDLGVLASTNNNVRARAFTESSTGVNRLRIMIANAVYSTQTADLTIPAGWKLSTSATQQGITGVLIGNQLRVTLGSVHSNTYTMVPI